MHSRVDPNLFYMDFERVSEVLLTIVVLALVIERALALLFESRWFIERVTYEVRRQGALTTEGEGEPGTGPIAELKPRNRGVKEAIALGVSLLVCWNWDFDAISILLPVSHSAMTLLGMFITAMVIAGGSKGAAKLFSDWLGIKSSAQKEVDSFKEKRIQRQSDKSN